MSITHESDQENDWSASNTKQYSLIQVVSSRLMDKKVSFYTKYTDIGQPTAPKSFITVVERNMKSNQDATTADSDCRDTVGRS